MVKTCLFMDLIRGGLAKVLLQSFDKALIKRVFIVKKRDRVHLSVNYSEY